MTKANANIDKNKDKVANVIRPHCIIAIRTCYCDWCRCEIRNGLTTMIKGYSTQETIEPVQAPAPRPPRSFMGSLQDVIDELKESRR